MFSGIACTGAHSRSPTELDLERGWRSEGLATPPWWRRLLLFRTSHP